MNIYLMRHFKVDFKWGKKHSALEFKTACERYDTANITNQTIKFNFKNIQRVYISELVRSQLTYKALNIDLKTYKTDLINEVPIAPFINTKLKLPTPVWMVIGRIQWFLNIKKQPEIKRDTLTKIETLIDQLEKEKKDTLIIGHGFYFSQLKRVLKKNNYFGNGKSHYKNGEIIRFNKTSS